MTIPILLFDLDGVLLQPKGYRAAIHGSMKFFLDQMGSPLAGLQEADIALFESTGITSEWDILPISLALVFESALQSHPCNLCLLSLVDAMEWVGLNSSGCRPPFYQSRIRMLPDLLIPGEAPSKSLLKAVRSGRSGSLLACLTAQPFLDDLLKNTRSVDYSMTTRVFQNLVLGNIEFQKIYRIQPSMECDSFLKLHDRPLILPENLGLLRRLQGEGRIFPAILTARPSLAPSGIPPQPGDSPEAEQALDLLGLNAVPLIGYGRLAFLANQNGADPESYLKPSPVQALAAISSACTGSEIDSLNWAANISGEQSGNTKIRILDLPPQMDIHIFEDTPIGIQSVQRAAGILNASGVQASVSAWGIAVDPNKKAALISNGAAVFDDVNQAINNLIKVLHINPLL